MNLLNDIYLYLWKPINTNYNISLIGLINISLTYLNEYI